MKIAIPILMASGLLLAGCASVAEQDLTKAQKQCAPDQDQVCIEQALADIDQRRDEWLAERRTIQTAEFERRLVRLQSDETFRRGDTSRVTDVNRDVTGGPIGDN